MLVNVLSRRRRAIRIGYRRYVRWLWRGCTIHAASIRRRRLCIARCRCRRVGWSSRCPSAGASLGPLSAIPLTRSRHRRRHSKPIVRLLSWAGAGALECSSRRLSSLHTRKGLEAALRLGLLRHGLLFGGHFLGPRPNLLVRLERFPKALSLLLRDVRVRLLRWSRMAAIRRRRETVFQHLDEVRREHSYCSRVAS